LIVKLKLDFAMTGIYKRIDNSVHVYMFPWYQSRAQQLHLLSGARCKPSARIWLMTSQGNSR